MTTLDRHVFRDAGRAVVVGVGIFVGLVLVRRGYAVIEIVLARDLGLRLAGDLLLLALPGALMYALPMASLFAAVSVFHRMKADREVIGVFGAGISPARLAAPAAPVALLAAAAALLVSASWQPRAVEAIESGAWARTTDPVAALTEGAVGRVGDWTLWAGGIDAQARRLERLLLTTALEGRHFTFVAPRGSWRLGEGEIRIVVEDGQILERDAEGRTHVLRFRRYETPVPIAASADGGRYARRAGLGKLLASLADPAYAIELQRRLAPPLACLAFFLLGPPLGLLVGRTGRTVPFAVSAAVFVAHYVVSGALENAIAAGRLVPWAYQVPAVAAGAAGLFLFPRIGRPA